MKISQMSAVLALVGLAACSGGDGAAPPNAVSPSDAGERPSGSSDAGAKGGGDAAAPIPYDAGSPKRADAAAPVDSGTKDGSPNVDAAEPADSGSDGGPPATHDAGPLPVDAGSAPVDAGPLATTEFAPYFPTWVWGGSGYATSGLADYQKKSGVNAVTLAFVLSGGGCKADQGIESNLSDVQAFIKAGGQVKASFGGADGTYVESQCTDAASYAKALEDFVDATGITDFDFDIEQGPVLTDAVNQMRGAGLKLVQDAKGVKVAFTLAANPSPSGGLTAEGLSVVRHAIGAGVRVSHVNLMTMDYGDSFGGKPLAPVAIGSMTDANAQLRGLVSGLTEAEAWKMLGVIPMIGKNDDSEVFSVADANTLASFITSKGLGLVAFWSVDRDQVCPSGADFNTCSTVNTANFQFSKIFQAVAR